MAKTDPTAVVAGTGLDDSSPRTRTDPRVLRTRQAFEDAVIGLLRQESGGTPTVRDIATAAGHSRTAFYTHYDSPEDLIAQVVRDQLLAQLDEVASAPQLDRDPPLVLVDLLRQLNEHRDLYAHLLAGASAQGRTRQDIEAHLASRFHVQAPREVRLFLAGGLLALVIPWAQSPDRVNDAAVANMADRLWTLALPIIKGHLTP